MRQERKGEAMREVKEKRKEIESATGKDELTERKRKKGRTGRSSVIMVSGSRCPIDII